MGYVLKDAIPDDLIHVIREVYAGRRVVAPEIQQALEQRATPAVLDAARASGAGADRPRACATRRLPSALGISPDTTGAHVKSIYTKLDVHDRTAALGEAIRRGLVHMP